MGTKSHRYTLNESEKTKKMSFEKKTVIQSIISVILLVCSLYVCYTDNQSFNFIKKYIRSSLDISTDVSYAKDFALNMYEKSGIKNFYKDKSDDTNQTDEVNTDIIQQEIEITQIQEDRTIIEYPKQENNYDENIMPSFRNPTDGEITSLFGARIHPVTGVQNTHTGIDIAGVLDQTVISAAAGRVIKCGEDDNNGKYIIIKHTGGYQSAYAHLNKICVIEGEEVDNNTKIGLMGSSGVSTGVHLHFEIKKDNERLDPEQFVKYKHR